jgi:hypothetical protein
MTMNYLPGFLGCFDATLKGIFVLIISIQTKEEGEVV